MSDDYSTPEERRALRRAEKAARAKEAQDNSVIVSLMAGEAGREWMRDLLGVCAIFRTTFTGDALKSAFNEGQRNIGLMLLAGIMRACPDAYVQMMKEQDNASRRDSRRPVDRYDPDDERNYDDAGRWIGEGDGPDDTA